MSGGTILGGGAVFTMTPAEVKTVLTLWEAKSSDPFIEGVELRATWLVIQRTECTGGTMKLCRQAVGKPLSYFVKLLTAIC